MHEFLMFLWGCELIHPRKISFEVFPDNVILIWLFTAHPLEQLIFKLTIAKFNNFMAPKDYKLIILEV